MAKTKSIRVRGEANQGKGHGTTRYYLYLQARKRIEESMKKGFNCEAIAIIESVISDRLESRLSYLTNKNSGFQTIGSLLNQLRSVEVDTEMQALIPALDKWRERRNIALHELVKVEDGVENEPWEKRVNKSATDAADGYDLLKWLYTRMAELNPNHIDRVFEPPLDREAMRSKHG